MDKLADLDTSFLVPCAHCDALFQEGERRCPSCGKDQQFAASAADDASSSDARFIRGSTFTTDQGVGWLGPRNGATEAAAPRAASPPPGSRSPLAARRWPFVAGATAAVILLALALMFGVEHYAGKREASGRQQAFDAAVTQLRSALNRDDLAGAARALDTLDPAQASEPDVLALKQTFDRRVAEQASRREQLSAAALKASRSLGFVPDTAPTETVSAVPAVASVPATPTPTSTPTPTALDAPPAACNEALAAMSLCQPK